MSLKSKIEAVIYASEEPVTLQQLVGLLADEAQRELDEIAAEQGALPLTGAEDAGLAGDAVAHAHEEAGEQGTADPAEDKGSTLESGDPERPSLSVDGGVAGNNFDSEADKRRLRDRERAVRDHVRRAVDGLIRDYAEGDRGIEIRDVASGFRMGTKPEYHDAVRGFVKSLKPALKLTLPALETLAVVAYKQPVTAAEISEIRGVDSAGVLGGLMARKLIGTAGRKQVIGRPMLYKTTRDFLLRFGLKDVQELPSMEEFERMAGELVEQEDLPMDPADTLIEQANARGDAEHIREDAATTTADTAASIIEETSEQRATAESAAGGNHEQHSQSIQHGQTQAAALHPTENSQHGPGADAGGEQSTGGQRTDGEEGGEAGQG